ncbi:MAG: VWA domain-containing protein [Deltaproteobacteria bacterium]|jgi:Ca-activated chloride channel family protein|nr:VWA domain-containing protein [Deltaproteobacteria bacterium]
MTLGAPWFLLVLLIVPFLVWRVVSRRGKGRIPVPSAAPFVAVPSLRTALWWVPDALRILAVVAVSLALARPRVPGEEVRTGEGVGILLLLDMSRSMYAVDMPAKDLSSLLEKGETPKNRFETAREVLKQFIVERNKSSADQIGLIIFGQEAWVRYPMTHDHARLIRSLNELVLDKGPRTSDGRCSNGCTVDGSGTAIGDALRRAYSQLSKKKDVDSKIIVLITDGKEMGGTTPAASIARHLRDLPPDERMRVYTFQVGGKGEMYVPRLDALGRQLITAQGVPIYEAPDEPFATDPDLLKEIAGSTGGKYYESYSGEKFKEDIADLARTAFESKIEQPKVDVFEWPLYIALGLLGLEWLLRLSLFRSVMS